jgi:DNA-binding CsgD family transcriptional regulator
VRDEASQHRDVLLGRERECQELERLLATARSGTSAVLAIVGEPGIGKTALLDYAAAHAGGLRVLRARGIESESNVAFAALLELLRPALGLLERIPAPQAQALEVALALRPGAGGDRFAVGAGTLALLAAFAEEAPALMLLDDAHLLDPSSAHALLFALRRLLADPLCVLLAVRAGEPSLLDGADLPTMRLAGIDRESTAELLGAVPAALAGRAHAATGGNPLALLALRDDVEHLGEAPAGLPVPVPAAIARAYARRAQELEEPARALLVLLAAGNGGELSAIERAAAGMGVDIAGIAAAEQAGFVRVSAGRVEFTHPLARAAIYGEATPSQRREAHRALAGALPDRDADVRAWHLAAAAVGTDEDAASAMEQVGVRARERSGYAAAAVAFARAATLAAEEQRRGALLVAAAQAAWSAGLGALTGELLLEARELDLDAALRVRVEHLSGRVAVRRGPVMDGHAILVRAAGRIADDDAELAIAILAEALDAAFFAGDVREMRRTALRISQLVAEGASERARFLAAITDGMARVMAGEGADAIASVRTSISIAEGSERLRQDPQLQPWLVMAPLWLREAQVGEELIAAAIENARADVSLDVLPWLLNRIARSHAATDAWAAAGVEWDEATSIAREAGQRVELATGLAGLAWLDARAGRAESARAHAAEALALCGELGVGLYEAWAMRALGELELGLGHPEAAVEHLQRLQAHLDGLQLADADLSPAPELIDAYLRLERREDAERAAARFEEQALGKGQPWSIARAERCRGLLAGEYFERHFEEALRLHERTPDLFERAVTSLAYGGRLRRARQRRRARVQLRCALELFEGLGARLLVDVARAELAATGVTARRRDPSTLDELTPQELRIAQLLAGGRTTREAAAALFLSPKTIEYHLRSVYRKLGISSRGELSEVLARLEGGGGGR